MKIGKYLIGLISGLTFGMLFAPKKGKVLRDNIVKKSSTSGAEGLKELGGAFLDAGEEAWSEIKNLSEHEQVEAFLEMSKDKIQNYLSTIEDKGYDVAGVAQEKLEELAEMATRKATQYRSVAKKKKTAVKKAVKKAVSKKVKFAKKKVSSARKKVIKKSPVKKTSKKK